MDAEPIPIKPQYQPNCDIQELAALRARVKEFTTLNEDRAFQISALKTPFLFLSFFGIYFVALRFGHNLTILFGVYLLMGILMMIIFLNVLHPAAHSSLFKNKTANEICLWGFELFGTSGFLWKAKHNRLHHPFPNIPQWDCDMEQSKLVKIFPESDHHKAYRFQHFYAPVLYLTYTLNWIFHRDFRDFFDQNRMVKRVIEFSNTEIFKLFFFKAFYLFYLLVIPVWLGNLEWQKVLSAFFLMHGIASLLGMILLVSTHAGEETTFTYPDSEGKVNQGWLMHQLLTTNDFAPNSRFISFLFGYLNHHVAHHVFPNLNPNLSIGVTEILRKFSEQNGLPYRSYSIPVTLRSHLKLLKRNSIYAV